MKTNYDDLTKAMTEWLKTEVKTETIIGTEFKLGNYSCVPVMAVGMGIGGGEGQGDGPKSTHGEGGASGAGVGMTPIGFLVASGNEINFISAKGKSSLGTAVEKLPDLLTSYFESRKREEAAVASN